MFGLCGKMKAHAGQRDALLDYLLQGAELLRELEGCYVYVISSLPDEPDAIWITEVWRSKDDHQASLKLDGVQAIIKAARPLIAAAPEGFEIVPHGGVGLPDFPRQ